MSVIAKKLSPFPFLNRTKFLIPRLSLPILFSLPTLCALSIAFQLLGAATTAQAVEEHLVTPGRPVADDISFDPSEPVTGYFHAGRSYECRIAQAKVSLTANDYLYFSTNITGPSGTITGTGVGSAYPAEAVTSTSAARQNLHRISFIPTATGVHSFSIVFDNNRTSDASVQCFETTLVGSFNSFLAAVPIVELRNRGNTPVTVVVTAVDLNGQQIEQQQKTVPASSREDAILVQIPSMTYGKVLVTYLGPQGLISGFISEYNYQPGPVLMRERPMTTAVVVP